MIVVSVSATMITPSVLDPVPVSKVGFHIAVLPDATPCCKQPLTLDPYLPHWHCIVPLFIRVHLNPVNLIFNINRIILNLPIIRRGGNGPTGQQETR